MTAQLNLDWGISTLGCHELALDAICKLAASHSIRSLEIRCLESRQDLTAYLDEVYKTPKAVQQILRDHKQQVVALNSSFSLIGAAEKDCNELLEFARWADALDIPYIRIFGGGKMAEPLPAEDLDRAAANLDWWHKIRLQNGWRTNVALETHDGFSSARRCLLLQAKIQHPLDIIWDTHHTWKLGCESPRQSWDQFSHLVRHVHIKDSISAPSARHPYTYVLPGTGEFPAQEVLGILCADNYQGVISLEWERKWHPYLPPLEQALAAMVSNGWKPPLSP